MQVVSEALGFGQVSLFVSLQNGGTGKRLAAHVTWEGSLACVHTAVILHVMTQLERLATVVASEWTRLMLLLAEGRCRIVRINRQ
jgi:hypothetical protein